MYICIVHIYIYIYIYRHAYIQTERHSYLTEGLLPAAALPPAPTLRGPRPRGAGARKGDDAVGNPRRAQFSQFELFELKFISYSCLSFILLLKLDKRIPIERFEASRAIRGSSISVGSTRNPASLPEFRLRGYPRVRGARVSDRTRWSPLGELFLRPRRTIARGPSLSNCQKPKALSAGPWEPQRCFEEAPRHMLRSASIIQIFEFSI